MTDEVDGEALQASFDLTFAAIHDIASSWVENEATSTSHVNSRRDIEEYMKRPPRLGVGAPLPESANLSRETARLKGQLATNHPKKRPHEDSTTTTMESDDEEESRTGAIGKRARKDPFAARATRTPNETTRKKGHDTSTGKLAKIQEDKQNGIVDAPSRSNSIPNKSDSMPPTSPQKVSITKQSLAPISLWPRETRDPSSKAISSVLNLEGPPIAEIEGANDSPKKKRKRRKKKKSMTTDE